jgi:hypothetical protein
MSWFSGLPPGGASSAGRARRPRPLPVGPAQPHVLVQPLQHPQRLHLRRQPDLLLGRQQRHLADLLQIGVDRVVLGVAQVIGVVVLVQVVQPVEQTDLAGVVNGFAVGRDNADVELLQALIERVRLVLVGRGQDGLHVRLGDLARAAGLADQRLHVQRFSALRLVRRVVVDLAKFRRVRFGVHLHV